MVDPHAKVWFKSWYNHISAKHGWFVESCLALAKQWAPDVYKDVNKDTPRRWDALEEADEASIQAPVDTSRIPDS
eukprot:4531249-Amphidinium_carterae.3